MFRKTTLPDTIQPDPMFQVSEDTHMQSIR